MWLSSSSQSSMVSPLPCHTGISEIFICLSNLNPALAVKPLTEGRLGCRLWPGRLPPGGPPPGGPPPGGPLPDAPPGALCGPPGALGLHGFGLPEGPLGGPPPDRPPLGGPLPGGPSSLESLESLESLGLLGSLGSLGLPFDGRKG